MIPLGIVASSRRGGVLVISDDFNRADGSLGANWTTVSGSPSIVSNAAANGSNANSVARHNTELPSADHYAQADATNPGTGYDEGVLVRFSASAMTCYMGRYSSGTGAWEIHKWVAGTATLLGSLTEAAPASPWTLRLEAQGTALRLYGNGVLKVSLTDSSVAGNLQAGFRLNATSNTADNFQAGTL